MVEDRCHLSATSPSSAVEEAPCITMITRRRFCPRGQPHSQSQRVSRRRVLQRVRLVRELLPAVDRLREQGGRAEACARCERLDLPDQAPFFCLCLPVSRPTPSHPPPKLPTMCLIWFPGFCRTRISRFGCTLPRRLTSLRHPLFLVLSCHLACILHGRFARCTVAQQPRELLARHRNRMHLAHLVEALRESNY